MGKGDITVLHGNIEALRHRDYGEVLFFCDEDQVQSPEVIVIEIIEGR